MIWKTGLFFLLMTVTHQHSKDEKKAQIPEFRKCSKEFTCLKKCEDNNCQAVATFIKEQDKQSIELTLWGDSSLKYVAFGRKNNTQNAKFMVDLVGQYCVKKPSEIVAGNFDATSITTNTAPKFIKSVAGVDVISTNLHDDGSFSCVFSVKVEEKDVYAALADGTDLSGDFPSYHGGNNYIKTKEMLDLFAISAVKTSNSPPKSIKAHGVLMVFAWLLFATFGIFMSRYMKPLLKKKILDKDLWFRCHQLFMGLTFLLFVTGLIVILIHLEGKWTQFAKTHGALGLIAIIFGLMQPIIAAFRCGPDASNRFIFNWVHRLIGMSAWVLAGLAVILGLDALRLDYIPVLVFLAVVVFFVIVLDVIVISNSHKNRAKYSSNTDSVEVDNEINKVEKYAKFSAMVVIYLFAIIIAIHTTVKIGES